MKVLELVRFLLLMVICRRCGFCSGGHQFSTFPQFLFMLVSRCNQNTKIHVIYFDWSETYSNQINCRLLSDSCLLQVFPFGSVPLKTYLPDGDIDLTAFGGLNVEEALASDVCSVLEREDQNRAAEFVVKDVQLIRAEVCSLQSMSLSFVNTHLHEALCLVKPT